MTRPLGLRGHAPKRWKPTHPVPWPDTGDVHLDLLRGGIEAHLYPYGDLRPSPGRPVATTQIAHLVRARAEGLDDAEAADLLSAHLSCGGTPVYHRGGDGRLAVKGTVTLAGRCGPADAMGRRAFWWRLTTTPWERGTGLLPTRVWEAEAAGRALREAFGIPWRPPANPLPTQCWEDGQGVLF